MRKVERMTRSVRDRGWLIGVSGRNYDLHPDMGDRCFRSENVPGIIPSISCRSHTDHPVESALQPCRTKCRQALRTWAALGYADGQVETSKRGCITQEGNIVFVAGYTRRYAAYELFITCAISGRWGIRSETRTIELHASSTLDHILAPTPARMAAP